MAPKTDKEIQFTRLIADYKEVVAKVCYLYMSANASFDDLYQEVLINLWQGLDSFRGEAKISTWIYRTALNTCITWHRRNNRHATNVALDQLVAEPPDTGSDAAAQMEQYRQLYVMISKLNPVDKALITLWLEDKPYDEIALITGLSQSNVGVRLHRIKDKLTKMAETENY